MEKPRRKRAPYLFALSLAGIPAFFAGIFGWWIDWNWSRAFFSNLLCPTNANFLVSSEDTSHLYEPGTSAVSFTPRCCTDGTVDDLHCEDASGLWTIVAHFLTVFAILWIASLAYIAYRRFTDRSVVGVSRLSPAFYLLGSAGIFLLIFYGLEQNVGSSSGEMPSMGDSVTRADDQDAEAVESQTPSQLLAATQALVQSRVKESGCYVATEPAMNSDNTTLSTTQTGCMEVVAHSTGSANIGFILPSGQQQSMDGQQSTLWRHCPTTPGKLSINIKGIVSWSLLRCPQAKSLTVGEMAPENTSEVKVVTKRLKKFLKSGCKRVIIPPTSKRGKSEVTLKLIKGRYCPVFVASTGVESSLLKAQIRSPLNEITQSPKEAATLTIVECADFDGEYSLHIEASAETSYALGVVDCSKKVIRRLKLR